MFSLLLRIAFCFLSSTTYGSLSVLHCQICRCTWWFCSFCMLIHLSFSCYICLIWLTDIRRSVCWSLSCCLARFVVLHWDVLSLFSAHVWFCFWISFVLYDYLFNSVGENAALFVDFLFLTLSFSLTSFLVFFNLMLSLGSDALLVYLSCLSCVFMVFNELFL